MKLSAFAKQQGISYQTAWRMWQRGELPAHQLPSGTVIVDVPAAPQAVRPQKVAVYARVSSTENRKNLDSQAERVVAFCAAKGWQVAKVVKECGSGVKTHLQHVATAAALNMVRCMAWVNGLPRARLGVPLLLASMMSLKEVRQWYQKRARPTLDLIYHRADEGASRELREAPSSAR